MIYAIKKPHRINKTYVCVNNQKKNFQIDEKI